MIQRPHHTLVTIPHRPSITSKTVSQKPTCMAMMTNRSFSLWRLPYYWATASKAKRRLALITGISGISFIGAILGPAFWLMLGGIGAVVSWRVYQQTKRWWQLINPSEQIFSSIGRGTNGSGGDEGLFDLLRRQVGSHQAAEQVQRQAITRLTEWARTDLGRKVLVDDLNINHIDDMTFYPPHSCSLSSQAMMVNGKQSSVQAIHVEFWAEANPSIHPRSGSCCIYVDAIVDTASSTPGQVQIKDIRLAAPGWHADEHVPISDDQQSKRKNVLEGEFRDVV
ncbi:hypothetical protein BDA99DRAFT_443560 [Phascolomyces articulosus]|uniref:Uncharacterized protein n=1 Tax=Phascolomyces articulosus TaxID=60185 RepID=A0AAD5K3M2_9FUNG|nr:hypothetical protein BDA99DRAFT_443560 [Phascolomyces articulosus]